MISLTPPSDQEVLDWLLDGPVMHWCVDNQYFYTAWNTELGTEERRNMLAFADDLAAFTWGADAHFITINIQDQTTRDREDLIIDNHLPVSQVCFDAEQLKAGPQEKGVVEYIDLVNSHYPQQYTHIKHMRLWDYEAREKLFLKKLMTFSSTKILATGAFANRCVGEAIWGAMERNYLVMLDPDLVWSSEHHRFDRSQALEKYKNFSAFAETDQEMIVTEPGQVKRVLQQTKILLYT